MNRILQADVVLTLSAEQAEGLLKLCEQSKQEFLWTEKMCIGFVALRDQCAKQGVQL
ncbi:hypothetical protein [Dyella terrae]|uniref:hypothetical protein n=1 Tax=Dyella terrae TaxID=522259 RepID=UPI001EFD7FFA|nr:hypothetical protein [Dyella terrae]ULU23797.1 hypothetical protein DYST_00695 [Dyella terrae]